MMDIEFKFPDWAAKLKAHEQELNLLQAAIIQNNRGLLFDQEGGRNGHAKWAPLVLRNGQVLSKRGTLRKSLAPYNANGTPGPDGIVRFSGDTIVVGTSLLYARMMNDGTAKMPGGVLRPVKAKALKIPVPKGAGASEVAREIHRAKLAPRIEAARERLRRAKKDSTREQALDTWSRLSTQYNKGTSGAGFIFVKSVKIPPRNFTDWNEQDQQEVDGALLSKVAEVLNE